jgi:hypothetical protein
MPIKRLPIPLKNMTPEQRRQYDKDVLERHRERKKLGQVRPRRSRTVTSQAIGSLVKAGAPPETLGQKNIYVSIDNAQRIDNCVAALSGSPLFLDQTSFFDAAIRNYCEALEEVHNGGRRFDPAPRKQYPRIKTGTDLTKPQGEKRGRGRPRKEKTP